MRPRVAVLIVISAVVLAFGAGTKVCGQKRSGQPEDLMPRKFDEFGRVGHCDVTARLDNLAVQLENEPGVTGYIVAYGPEGEGIGTGRTNLELLKDYLFNTRGLTETRLKTIYAGRNQDTMEPKFELWIVPRGAAAPEPLKMETNVETFKGRFVEVETEDYLDLLFAEEMGPGIGLAIDAAFADMLHQQKKAIPYVVTYNGEEAVPGSARRLAARKIKALKRYDVDASRIKTIFGGVRKKTTLQLWLLSPGDPPPTVDAGAEQPPKKNVMVASEGDDVLGTPENERAVFNRMLDVLRTQPTLKAVAIVNIEAPQPEPDAIEEEANPPAELPKVVQKWRDELINTHKIGPDRFIVLFATTPADRAGNYIDIWAMPPGQPLPDPNADEEDATEEDTEPPFPDSPLGSLISSLISSYVVQNAQRRP
jgi:hypothetical protein